MKNHQHTSCTESESAFLHDHHGREHHNHSLVDELILHFPLAVFSVAMSIIVLSLMSAICSSLDAYSFAHAYHQLFHSFHYLHIVFACIGTLLTFFQFSSALLPALIVGIFSPAIFCVLSDVILPFVAGKLLGLDMQLHVCFFSEYFNITSFLLIGVLTGFFLHAQAQRGHDNRSFLRVVHFSHILLSSLASLFYMVSHGFNDWTAHLGIVFIVMIICVVVPCTMSDVVVPIAVAHLRKKNR